MNIKNTIIEHYRKFFDLHAKGIALDEDDHLNLDWAEDLVKNCFIPNVMQWVAVSERLPERNCSVLAYKSSGLISQMSFHAPFDSGKRQFHWWGFGTWINQHSQVTHWMRIPEPPCV